ncbi:MAG: hypothetical protein NVS3B21_19160 [Acidimicrobiales bacterium]
MTVRELADRPMVVATTMLAGAVDDLFGSQPDLVGIVVVDGSGRPTLVSRSEFALMIPGPNRFGRELYGRRPIGGLPFSETLVLNGTMAVVDASALMLARPLDHRYDDCVVVNDDGTVGLLLASVVIEALSAQFAYQASHDSLTGLANRTALTDRLVTGSEVGQATAVLFIDLDRFKIVNDSLGHAAGDRLLDAVGGRLSRCLREGDVACRLGGDEFVLLVEGVETVEDAEDVAKRVLAVIDEPFELDGTVIHLTASIGVSLGQLPSSHPDGLLREADLAMYAAKNAGRARHRVFERSLASEAGLRFDLHSGLRRALDQNEFFLVFQPIVDLTTSCVVQVEALLRWNHPERGIVAPLEFIPMAEENGLIVPLGSWVLEQACRIILRNDADPEGVRLSVNVAARQLAEVDFVSTLMAIFEETGFPPARLTLELTESAASQDIPGLVESLEYLTGLGIGLALDDFGTGFSSLVLLQRLPLTNLKIDRSFVSRMSQSAKESALVRLTIEMAHALDLVVTAEGIEDDLQRAALVGMGCEFGQGYLFDRPLTADQLSAHLRVRERC